MGDSKIILQEIAVDLRRIRIKALQQELQRAKEERKNAESENGTREFRLNNLIVDSARVDLDDHGKPESL